MPREMRECLGNEPIDSPPEYDPPPRSYLDPICLECGSQRVQEDIDANAGLCPVCESEIVTPTIEQMNALLLQFHEADLDNYESTEVPI